MKTIRLVKNIKKAISQNPNILDILEKYLPNFKSQLDLILKESKHLLIMIEVPLLFEKDFKVSFSYRSINVFCTNIIHRKRLNLRFGQSKNHFKKNNIKKTLFTGKKSIFQMKL